MRKLRLWKRITGDFLIVTVFDMGLTLSRSIRYTLLYSKPLDTQLILFRKTPKPIVFIGAKHCAYNYSILCLEKYIFVLTKSRGCALIYKKNWRLVSKLSNLVLKGDGRRVPSILRLGLVEACSGWRIPMLLKNKYSRNCCIWKRH